MNRFLREFYPTQKAEPKNTVFLFGSLDVFSVPAFLGMGKEKNSCFMAPRAIKHESKKGLSGNKRCKEGPPSRALQDAKKQGGLPAGLPKNTFLLCLFVLAALLLLVSGCVQESESKYVIETDTTTGALEKIGDFETGKSQTIIGFVIQEWRLFCIIFMLISLGMIALAYPVSSAFGMPSLKAWADVELGEVFSTAFIVMFVLAILVFAEVTTQALILETSEFAHVCDVSTRFCPVAVANSYLDNYLDASGRVYDDLFENAVKSGKKGTFSTSISSSWFWALYSSVSLKPIPKFMIDVTTAGQEMQFLLGMRDALFFQKFILNHVSSTLAPMALMLGIIFRSFFVTRKMGGLLMAFGIGFLLVFPTTYAIAYFTTSNTLYGSSVTGGEITTELCPPECRQLPPAAFNALTGEKYTRSNITKLFPPEGCSGGFFCQDGNCASQVASDVSMCDSDEEFAAGFCIDPFQSCETDEEYKERIDEYLLGQKCSIILIPLPLGDPVAIEVCKPIYSEVSPEIGETIFFCGAYNEKCPPSCRTLPYPNILTDCASRMTEFQCRENVPEQCFIIRYANIDSPELHEELEEGDLPGDKLDSPVEPMGGLSPPSNDTACPEKCRPLNGLKKTGCDVGYGFKLEPDMTVGDVHDKMVADGYTKYDIYDACDTWWWAVFCDEDDSAERLLYVMSFDDAEENKTIVWDEGCPNRCRWVSTAGRSGPGCRELCPDMPSEASASLLMIAARSATTLEEQIMVAESTCYMIIPKEVFTDTDCLSCDYLLDPGFASYPPIHQRCDKLCGGKRNLSPKKNKESYMSATDGFNGPAEMKAITKLTVPALVLPLFCIVITFIFIRTLSPMLGGDIDIPGMMKMIR